MVALRRYVRTLTEGISLATFPATVGLGLVARELVPVALGKRWEGVIAPLEVLSVYVAVRSIIPVLSRVMTAVGNARFVMWNDLAALCFLPIAFFVGSHWGVAGIAWGWVVGYPFVAIPLCLKTFKTIGMTFREYFQSLRPALDGTVLMRRLSIVDLATGHQPISNEDGSIWIVFNGEIYNHRELRERLIARGHSYRTHSDTETIVHLYEEYGQDCVQHLRGMFAFAIWDTRQRKLFIARDRLGIKPLYYQLTRDRLVFGSEIKVLFEHPSVHAEFRRASLPEFLAFGYLSGAETFYQNIDKLMPGHWMEVSERGDVRIEQYWDLKLGPPEGSLSENEYVSAYRDLLEGAVNSHLMSDVPLGVFLSGGVDSSAVAALMTKIRREPVETFSVGYSEHNYSELPYARIVADHIHSMLYGKRE